MPPCVVFKLNGNGTGFVTSGFLSVENSISHRRICRTNSQGNNQREKTSQFTILTRFRSRVLHQSLAAFAAAFFSDQNEATNELCIVNLLKSGLDLLTT